MGSKPVSRTSSAERLAAINRAITSSLSFEEVLSLIVVNAVDLVGADASLLLLAGDDGVLRVKASHGLPQSQLENFSGRMEEVMIRELSKALRLKNTEKLVTIPVLANGSLSGLLAVIRRSPLNDEEYWQLSALADQAAIALNNARLHELITGEALRERDRSLQALRESEAQLRALVEQREELLEREQHARQTAEEANRLKDEFLATLSHELRNPLNVILGYSEMLLRSSEFQESQFMQQASEALRRNALAQAQLISDLLDLSRLHMGKLSLNVETVLMSTIISNAIETVRDEAAAKDINIVIDAREEGLFVEADPVRLEQAVWNLLNNAVKFTPNGGTITISLRKQNNDAVLTIKDTGQGIDPQFLPHVFEMFRQADASWRRQQSGLGIGLALVRQLIELHGGTVRASSRGRGQGAEFAIQIPLGPKSDKQAMPESLNAAEVLSGMRILVLDDSHDTVAMLQCLLESDGAEAVTARSGAEALQIAAVEQFDVVLSDLSMPEMDGFEFARRLHRIPGQHDVPIVALTGFGRSEDIERSKAEGFFAHAAKPVNAQALLEILRALPSREMA